MKILNKFNKYNLNPSNILLYISSILVFSILVNILWHKIYNNIKNLNALNIKAENLYDKKNIVPVAIIGSGPAGLSAGIYSARLGAYSVIFQGPTPGGLLTTTSYVENWPGIIKTMGSKIMDTVKMQAELSGALISTDSINEVDFSNWPFKLKTSNNEEVYAMAVIIATGASPKKLNIKGEKEYWGAGVTSCAICDAPFYKNKDVIVVGGGDSAIEEAILLSFYANKITILVRSNKMRASSIMQNRIKKIDKIEVVYNSQITKIYGNGESVNGVKIKNSITNEIIKKPIDGIFLAIGHEPNSKLFSKFLNIDKNGVIEVQSFCQKTSLEGIFAAGEVSDFRYRQAITSSGQGVAAAIDAYNWLHEKGFDEELYKKIELNYFDPFVSSYEIDLIKINNNQDLDNLIKDKKPIVIKVSAEYCPPCKTLEPVVKSVAAQFESKIIFAEINKDNDPHELVKRLNLKETPEILILNNGKITQRFKGVLSKKELYNLVINNVNI